MKLRSITQEKALDEFLSTAELAGTEFTAERKNIKIVSTDSDTNPYLLTPQQESVLARKHSENKLALRVPRRPAWTASTTPEELERLERDAFLDWRRGLAKLQESDALLLTPFERNLEVWRQLWRVVERSDLVVQIVDARNPLLFRTEDLERYVLELDTDKKNLLLLNKADLMTEMQRLEWAKWFDERGIHFAFYSARLAREAIVGQAMSEPDASEESDPNEDAEEERADKLVEDIDNLSIDSTSDFTDDTSDIPDQPSALISNVEAPTFDPRTRILTVDELQLLFLRESPPPKGIPPRTWSNLRP